jgi:hypothetical protein
VVSPRLQPLGINNIITVDPTNVRMLIQGLSHCGNVIRIHYIVVVKKKQVLPCGFLDASVPRVRNTLNSRRINAPDR